ncbi:MAG: ribosome biogenesis GTPase Der [Candidatus Nitrohelix vancouverensis]|uniref:GTPase Der n=1 Tax=Candidatus Nitrohelix vancouverensis TaxID=2705534 RepID=A0A7T0C2U8_9BACT|nr:MAG: ribosome biogenesis GTPase Der [Candidatus Nitrohelix vancouverensis]
MPAPTVAIVGRANVGKSTLFNRLVKRKTSIVNNVPGVTRDRLYGQSDWLGKTFDVIDTGGFDFDHKTEIELQMIEQARIAETEADVVIVVLDLTMGLTLPDREVVQRLRKAGKSFFVAANKADVSKAMDNLYQFNELGVDNVFPISAEHGTGVADLADAVVGLLPEMEEEDDDPNLIRIAVVGKPNAGKSSLINQLLHSKRCIVSETPGATRDAIDTRLEENGQSYLLVDTAGIRRKGRTREVLQKFAVIMALKALDRCDIALLIIDGEEGITDQDAHIAGYAKDKGRGCIIVLNKWDSLKKQGEGLPAYEKQIKQKLKFLDYAPVIALSALTGDGVSKLLPLVQEVHAQYSKSVPTAQLNDCFEQAIAKNPMSSYRGKFIKMFYATQIRSQPPLIKCFVNFPQGIHFSYQRYLANSLRKRFGFEGTPLKLIFSGKKEGR